MREVVSAVFDTWLERLRVVYAMPDGEEKEQAVVTAMTGMAEADPTLVVCVEDCAGGCCPGDLVLLSLEHPTVPPELLVTVFPEQVTSDVVKKRGLIASAHGEENR